MIPTKRCPISSDLTLLQHNPMAQDSSVKREKASSQAVSDEGKERRHEAKCTLAVQTGKDSAKTECHKTVKWTRRSQPNLG